MVLGPGPSPVVERGGVVSPGLTARTPECDGEAGPVVDGGTVVDGCWMAEDFGGTAGGGDGVTDTSCGGKPAGGAPVQTPGSQMAGRSVGAVQTDCT